MPKLAKMFNETIEQINKITNIYSDIRYFSYNIQVTNHSDAPIDVRFLF